MKPLLGINRDARSSRQDNNVMRSADSGLDLQSG
jgi:hypothetical protein